MTVADVGAGFGAWTLGFSRWTGPAGGVYATDIAEEALAVLRAVVAREGLSNVTVIVGAATSTNLPAACCDAILVRNVYHYLLQVLDSCWLAVPRWKVRLKRDRVLALS